ncbi:MAG: DUF445 family protein [Spirochaetia bacterium]|nr:DUF445 family protein [Spirochaetia bacterium]
MESPFRKKKAGAESAGERPRALSADQLLAFLSKWGRRLTPIPEPSPVRPPPAVQHFSLVLFFLKALPLLAVAAFAVSLFWDTTGQMVLPWRDQPVPLKGLLRMIAVSALIGYGTNWVAIKMLFYPRQKHPLLGQGLIPGRKDKIVMRLADSITEEIINSELILEQVRASGLIRKHREKILDSLRDVMRNREFRADLLALTELYVTSFLRSGELQHRIRDFVKAIDFEDVGALEGGIIKIYRFLQGDQDVTSRLEQMTGSVTFRAEKFEDALGAYLDELPDTIGQNAQLIEDYALGAIVFLIEQINVRDIVQENLRKFDEIRLERLLLRSTSDQLQFIVYLGTLLGILGGFFIWLPFESTALMGTLGALIFVIDAILYRRKAASGAGRDDATSHPPE